MTEQVCPTCGGKKRVATSVRGNTVLVNCPTCGGKGKIKTWA